MKEVERILFLLQLDTDFVASYLQNILYTLSMEGCMCQKPGTVKFIRLISEMPRMSPERRINRIATHYTPSASILPT